MKKGFFLILTLATAALFVAGHIQLALFALATPLGFQASLNPGAAGAEILTRYFSSEIQPKLFPSASFMMRALNDDAFVNNNTVELPHSGTNPSVSVDRNVLPAPISKRDDAATNYQLEELTTDPTLLQDSEGLIIAYDKRNSISSQHGKTINTKAADRCLYKWGAGATGNHILKTTGTTRTASGPSQTGNRNKITKADIIKTRQLFFSDDVITENDTVNGIAILTPAQYGDLLELSDLTEAQKYGRATFPTGVIDRVLGFDIYIRSRVIVYDNSDALKAEGAAGVTTDQDAALFYHPDFVRRAKGLVKAFIQVDNPAYYGTIMSYLVRFGATVARNDNKGIVTLMEDNG